jgi:acetaldehyde dehydrogenase (acetylating)|tara:strand:- start:225 stop:629 length:405 start_codon:yes stop_codon:yes gene_type:complete
MAKESGLGMSIAVDDSASAARTISNDITNLDWTTPREVQDITGLDKSARETLLTLADFTITINGIFNDASNMSHDVFKTVSSTSVARTVTITISGQTLPNETNFTDYSLSRGTTGELTYTAPGVLAGGTVPTWA